MSLHESARPDIRYIRSRGAEGYSMGCGGSCPACRGAGDASARPRPAEGSTVRRERDPRYSWLPP